MSEPETILSLITDAACGVPEPVKKSFIKALSDLLGGLAAIPAAKLRQYTQGIEDATTAKSMVAEVLAKAAVTEVSGDLELAKVAAEIYLPATIRKAKNRLGVAQLAAEHLGAASVNDSGEKAASPDDDWMNSFMRFAEDASSERLQDLFGRILAGQILRPGAFGLATLRTISELDQALATDFMQAWAASVGDAVDYNPDWQLGDGFSRWKRLVEAGLMASANTSQFLPPFKSIFNGTALWSPINVDNLGLLVHFQEGSSSRWDHIDFTRVGKELGLLLPRPDYKENIRKVGYRLPRGGVTRIEILDEGNTPEVIWQAS
ncbi:DUF2806 domain-containing protein [Pseudomonas thivervalensis]|uniref:DUF2806 domain-containing protein n=1 Tax=Pseudomonas thivervalensis TaxID=86265 RepID=UPI003D655263